MDEISREQLVLFDRTSSYSELTNAVFRSAGVRPDGVMELDNIDAAKKMVQEGFGVALIPYTAVADELDAGLLCRVEIEDAEPLRRQIVAVRRRDRSAAGGAAESFLSTLREMQPELSRS
jgi:DNA-binding transcriptional LysR family regulator